MFAGDGGEAITPDGVIVRDLEVHLHQRPMSSSAEVSMDEGVGQLVQLGTIISSTFGAVRQRFDEVIEKSDIMGRDIDGELEKQKETIVNLEKNVLALHEEMGSLQAEVGVLQGSIQHLTSKCDEMADTIVTAATAAAEAAASSSLAAAAAAGAAAEAATIVPLPDASPKVMAAADDEEFVPVTDAALKPLLDRIDSLETSLADQQAYNEELSVAIQRMGETMQAMAATPAAAAEIPPPVVVRPPSARLVSRPASARLPSQAFDEEKVKDLVTMIVQVHIKNLSEHVVNSDEYQEETEFLKSRLTTLEEDLKEQKESTLYTQQATENQIADLETSVSETNRNCTFQVKELSTLVTEVQEAAQSALGLATAVKRIQNSMNDAMADIDELKYKQSFMPEDMMMTSQNQKGSAQKDTGAGANAGLENDILAVKQKLLDLRDDLDTGLDAFADAHAADPEGSEAFESEFIAKVAEFADHLDGVVVAFDAKGPPDTILDAVFHPLDLLSIEMEQLFDWDKASVAAMGITFDDLTPEESTRPLRTTLQAVFKMTLPLLDYRVDKITMRRRVEKLETLVREKADSYLLTDLENELRSAANAKADRQELLTIAAKKVSIGELQGLKDQLMKQIVGLRGEDHAAAASSHPTSSSSSGVHSEQLAEFTMDLKRLKDRFDVFHNLHEDLATQCELYVPREEVEQALRALLNEMKLMKTNSVAPDQLRESLKLKANSAEVQKLVGALTAALGDIAGKSNVASAVRARCLVCDKPVKSLSLAPVSTAKRAYSPERSSANQYSGGVGGFYDKPGTGSLVSATSQGSTWGSNAILDDGTVIGPATSSVPETASVTKSSSSKYSSDFTIIRNSIDLPPIDDNSKSPTRLGSGGGSAAQQIKQRIRAGAGGGIGPHYTQDSR